MTYLLALLAATPWQFFAAAAAYTGAIVMLALGVCGFADEDASEMDHSGVDAS